MNRSLIFLLVFSCHPFHELVVSAIPNSPDPSPTCVTDNIQRCNGNVPEACHAEDHRWWPMLARNAQGTQRVCESGCQMEAGNAFCAPDIDGSVGQE